MIKLYNNYKFYSEMENQSLSQFRVGDRQERHFVFDFETTTIDEKFDKVTKEVLATLSTSVWLGTLLPVETKNAPTIVFKNIDDFMKMLVTTEVNTNIYSFNGSNFDNRFIIDWLGHNDYHHILKDEYAGPYDKYWCGDRNALTIYHHGIAINLIDIRKIIPGSLRQIGSMLTKYYNYKYQLNKGPETPMRTVAPEIYHTDEIQYAVQDVIILKYLMNLKEFNICRLTENEIYTAAQWSYLSLINEQRLPLIERPVKPKYLHAKPVLEKDEKVDFWYLADLPSGRQGWAYEVTNKTQSEIELDRAIAEVEKLHAQDYRVKFKRSLNTMIEDSDSIMKQKPKLKAEYRKRLKGLKKNTSKYLSEIRSIKKERLDTKTFNDVNILEQQALMKIMRQVINRIAKVAYRGGITFVNGKFIFNKVKYGLVLDYTSHYPAIYAFERLPGAMKEIIDECEDFKIEDIDLNQLSLVTFKSIHAKAHDNVMQIFKPKTKDDYNKYVMFKEHYDYGAIYDARGVYTREFKYYSFTIGSPSLAYLLENYDIYDYEIDQVIYFEDNVELMKRCQLHYYHWIKIKEESDDNPALRLLAKLMLNSPYGKFGNYEKEYERYYYVLENGIYKQGVFKDKDKGGRKAAEVPVAAFISEYGRVKLGRAVNTIGYERFIYSDTDSIHISGWELPENIDLSGAPGELKLEYRFKDGIYIKAKTYASYKEIPEDDYNKYLENGDKFIKADEDGYFKWNTTCAGISMQVEPDKFKPGLDIPDKQGYGVPGGTVILDIEKKLNKIPFGIARLIKYETGVNLPEEVVCPPNPEENRIIKFQEDVQSNIDRFLTEDEKQFLGLALS